MAVLSAALSGLLPSARPLHRREVIKPRPLITHLTAFVAGAAIAGPLALAFGHTEKGIGAGDWLSLPNAVVAAIIGGLFTYALQPKSPARSGRAAVEETLVQLRRAAMRAAAIEPSQIPDNAVLDEAQANARRLTAAANRYQYARALTPPEETVAGWNDVDAAVLELKSGLHDAERGLATAAVEHGTDFIRQHLEEVKQRFGKPLERAIDRVAG